MKVDIISIPWGIREESGNICVAMAEANKKCISVLAAGPNAPRGRYDPFPASLGSVISIGSSDGLGEPSHLSLRYITDMYCALGEGVMGANPIGSRENDSTQLSSIRRDGTSVATCVATGLAALLIDYARRFLDGSCIKPNTLQAILHGISEASTQRFYRYISPWGIFGPNKDTKETLKNIMNIVVDGVRIFPLELRLIKLEPIIPMQSKLSSCTGTSFPIQLR